MPPGAPLPQDAERPLPHAMAGRMLASRQFKYALVIAVYLLCGWWVLDKGLDLTDTGYHLTNQMSAAKLGWEYIGFLPVYWFSGYLSGTLFGGFNLVQVRGAAVALGAFQLVMLLYILHRRALALTWPLTAVMALLGAFMLAPLGFLLLLPDYYSIPTAALYVLLPVLAAFVARPGRLSLAMLVALTLLLLNLRLTTGLLVATLPGVMALILYVAFRTKPALRWLGLFYGSILGLATAELLYITLFHPHIWEAIAAAEWKNPKVHNLPAIRWSYFTETARQLLLTWPMYLVAAAFLAVRRFRPLRWEMLPWCLLAAWMAARGYRAVTLDIWSAIPVQGLAVTSYVLGVTLVGVLWFHNRAALQRQAPFVLAAFALPIALFAGSNTGIIKVAYGLPLVAAAVLVLADALPRAMRRHVYPAVLAFYAIGLGLVVNAGLQRAYENVLTTPVAQLTYTMQHGKLAGVRTTPQSGRAVDETVAQVLSLTTPADTIFTFPSVPLFHYATGRYNTILDIPNFDILQPLGAIRNKVGNRLCLSPQFTPRLLVFSRHYVFDPLWPTAPQGVASLPATNVWGVTDVGTEIFGIVERNCRPTVLWQNEYFTILQPHPAHTGN